ncbi:unnamed protein product, partial [Candidula unifasciata]
GLAAAVTLVLVALLAIIIYKKRHYLFRQAPPVSQLSFLILLTFFFRDSQCKITFSKINEDESGDTVSLPDNTQYHNPMFNNPNL